MIDPESLRDDIRGWLYYPNLALKREPEVDRESLIDRLHAISLEIKKAKIATLAIELGYTPTEEEYEVIKKLREME